MGLLTFNLARLGTLVTALSLVAARIDESKFAPRATITKDVVILGGGASGAYAAFKLREDFKKSVLLVEKQDHLVRLTWVSFFFIFILTRLSLVELSVKFTNYGV